MGLNPENQNLVSEQSAACCELWVKRVGLTVLGHFAGPLRWDTVEILRAGFVS